MDRPQHAVGAMVWFNHHLKNEFKVPETPKGILKLNTREKIPKFFVKPDPSLEIHSVDIFYTQQGNMSDHFKMGDETKYWHHVPAESKKGVWSPAIPIRSTDLNLWVYADVQYKMNKGVNGAGYGYNIYNTNKFNLSTLMEMVDAETLQAANIKDTMKETTMIQETFNSSTLKGWYRMTDIDVNIRTLKLTNPKYKAPKYSKISIDVRAEKPNHFVFVVGGFWSVTKLKGGNEWQQVILYPSDVTGPNKTSRTDWEDIKEISTRYTLPMNSNEEEQEVLPEEFSKGWVGKPAELRNLSWIEVTREEFNASQK